MAVDRRKPDDSATVICPSRSSRGVLWLTVPATLGSTAAAIFALFDGDAPRTAFFLFLVCGAVAIQRSQINEDRGTRLADHGVYASTVTGWQYYGAAAIKSVDVVPSEDVETGTISHCVGLSRHRGRPVFVYWAEDRGEAEAKAREVGERLHKPMRLM